MALTEDAMLEGALPQKSTMGETAPMENPTGMLVSVELSSREIAPTMKPIRELDMPMTMDTTPVRGPLLHQYNVRGEMKERVDGAGSLVG